jgi:adenosylhomocysteine nucleosidase
MVVESGIGTARAENTVAWLLSRPALQDIPYRPEFVVSAGFAGALQEGYQVGDILVATEVLDPEGNCWPTSWPGEPAARPRRAPTYSGRLVTVKRILSDPANKKALGARFDALAVDMEAAVVARLCSRAGVPFGCVRAISDGVHTPLSPQLASLLSVNRVSSSRLLAALARQPTLAVELWRLARDTRLAAAHLAVSLAELLTP